MNGMSNWVRQITVSTPRHVELGQHPAPIPSDGEVTVRTSLVGVCGTDVHAYRGEHPFISLPYVPGHEVVGIVEELGAGVDTLRPGERIVVEPNLSCGRCRHCQRGQYNVCEQLSVFGCQTPGAMTDLFTVPAGRTHRIPEGMTDYAAVLVEPMATPVHAVRRAGDIAGKNVLILGAGPIGLLTVLAAQHAGAAEIVTTDLLADKRERSLRLGASSSLRADAEDLAAQIWELLGGPADVIFDCVSNSYSIAQAIRVVDKGGTVMVVGVPAGPLTAPFQLVQDREITLRGSLMYTAADIRTALDIIGSGSLSVEELISTCYPLDRCADAFAAAERGDQMKILVQP